MADPNPRTQEPELAQDVEVHIPAPDAAGSGAQASEATLSRGGDAELARDVDRATGGAARDLARAFQANAEALQSMHEIQAQLATALKRGDRSEMVVQSTQALNETFRNLTTIQRQMLSQMEAQQAATRRTPLVPLMILGLLIVVLGGIYLIIDQLQQARPSMEEMARARDENEHGRLEAYREGQTRGMEEGRTKLTTLGDELERSRIRQHALEQDRDAARADVQELQREKRAVEIERDDFADRAVKAQNEAMARKLMEDESRAQKAKLAVAEARLAQFEEDLKRERERSLRLMKERAAYGYGLKDDAPLIDVRYPDREPASPVQPSAQPETPEPAPIDLDDSVSPSTPPPPAPPTKDPLGMPPAGPGELPSPTVLNPDGTPVRRDPSAKPGAFPPPTPPVEGGDQPATKPVPVDWRRDLNRNPVLTGNVRSIVNRLLGAGSNTTRSRTEWQLSRLGGVTQDLLGDVMLLQYDTAGRLVGNISAQEMRLVADRAGKLVSVTVKNGKRVFDGKSEPLPASGYRLIVAKGEDHVRAWQNSGLVMVHEK